MVDTVINILLVRGIHNATKINASPRGANTILIAYKDFIAMVVQFASDWTGQAPSLDTVISGRNAQALISV